MTSPTTSISRSASRPVPPSHRPHADSRVPRAKIESSLGIQAYNSYGLSEMNGPGVAFECVHQQGMHLWEDHYLLEIISPETSDPVADCEPGEIERILMAAPELDRNDLIELDGLDEMMIKVELSPARFDGHVDLLVQLEKRLVDKLRAEILTKPKVELVAPETLPVSEGKAKRVIDRRTL